MTHSLADLQLKEHPRIPRWAPNSPGDRVTAPQWRMARAAVKIGIRELAKLASTSVNSVVNIEKGVYVHYSITDRIRKALEKKGVEFTENGVEFASPS